MLAFDAKDFIRRKIYQEEDPETHEIYLSQAAVFYTPLGVGIKFKNKESFKKVCIKRIGKLAKDFNLSQKRFLYDSNSLKEELSHRRAIPFCDQLVYKLRRYIELVHYTYVVMPPDKFPTVTVGGFKSPRRKIKSAEFLRNLQPMFSHICAWNYFGIKRGKTAAVHLDGFNSKQTHAWNDLISKVKPKIFPHGDECNPYIMLADLVAYLTDAKLYTQKLGLEPSNLQKIWESYGFQTEIHYLDINHVPSYGWHSEEPIDINPYLAHPMVFLLVDELEKIQPISSSSSVGSENEQESKVQSSSVPEEQRFKKLVRRMEPWYAVTAYAYYKGGGAQLFNYGMDRTKVQDGDTMVYIGNKSKELAESFSHMLDIEVLSAKEIRKFVNRKKG